MSLMHSRVVPGCAITTKGLTGTFHFAWRADGESILLDLSSEFMRLHREQVSKRHAGDPRSCGCRSLDGRKRSHKTDSEGSVFCGGELTANAERVYSRKSGRQRFSFVVVSMDWRRCTPEWSHRRCHYL